MICPYARGIWACGWLAGWLVWIFSLLAFVVVGVSDRGQAASPAPASQLQTGQRAEKVGQRAEKVGQRATGRASNA